MPPALSERTKKGGPSLALKAVDEPLPLRDGGSSVKHEAGPPEHAVRETERAGR